MQLSPRTYSPRKLCPVPRVFAPDESKQGYSSRWRSVMSLLLRCSRIVDGVGGTLTQHGVLIEGEHIARVAPMGEFQGYSGPDMVLDDATLLPGLIDCHVHLCFDAEPNPGEVTEKMHPGAIAVRALSNAQRSIYGGITAIRDCGGKDYLEFAARDACNRGTFQGQTVRASGRMI
ncbi:MAG: hypothetical protein E4H01_12185, partial [Lysobacterales bacterium]